VSTYKEIVGQKITKVTSDPSDPKTGQMWYNTTTGEIKALQNLQAWSSGGTLLDGTAGSLCGGFGTQTAGQIAVFLFVAEKVNVSPDPVAYLN
jgi:hypothetical protein